MNRYDLTDFEWSMIETVAAEQASRRPACGRPERAQRHHVGAALRRPLARPVRTLRALHHLTHLRCCEASKFDPSEAR